MVCLFWNIQSIMRNENISYNGYDEIYNWIMPIIKNVGFNGWISVVFEGQDELDEPTAVPLANAYLRSLLTKYEM